MFVTKKLANAHAKTTTQAGNVIHAMMNFTKEDVKYYDVRNLEFTRSVDAGSVINLDLSATHVPRMTLVRLDALTTGVRDEACHAKCTLPVWVIDPCDVDKTIIDSSEWVHYHASVCILSIVNHQKRCRDAIVVLSGDIRLIVNGQLIVVFNEAAAEG